MPRALWSGTLSFGLVNVPVRLHSAVRDHDLRFHLLHREDGARIETRRFCEREDAEVGWDEIGHGYERRDDEAGREQERRGHDAQVHGAGRTSLAASRAHVVPNRVGHSASLTPTRPRPRRRPRMGEGRRLAGSAGAA